MTNQHTSARVAPSRGFGRHFRYRTVDLVVVVMIGVAFGVAFVGYAHLYTLLSPITDGFPPSAGLLAGFWLMPAAIAMLVVRKPGAALGAEMIAALFEPLLGSKFSWGAVVSGFVQGLGFEVVFALAVWASTTLPVLLAGALVSASFEWVYEILVYYPEWSMTFKGILLVLFWVSAVVVPVLLGRALVGALARAGALSSFEVGRAARVHTR